MTDPHRTAQIEAIAVALFRWQWDTDDDLSATDVTEAEDYRAMARVALEAVSHAGAARDD